MPGALAGLLLGVWMADMPDDRQPEQYQQYKRAAAMVRTAMLQCGVTTKLQRTGVLQRRTWSHFRAFLPCVRLL